MAKELFVSSTPHETKVAIVEDDQLAEIYFERENEYTLAGSIYKGRVTRVLPGMQSAFVDIGLERDAFLYVSDFFEDQEEYDAVVTRVEEDVAKGSQRPSTSVEARTPASGSEVALPQASSPAPHAGASPPDDGGSRRWRGRRRRRGRGGRDFERQAQPQSAQPAPTASEAPREQAADPPPPPVSRPVPPRAPAYEPMILPGESISKYRRMAESHAHASADSAALAFAAPVPAAAEATEAAEPTQQTTPPASTQATLEIVGGYAGTSDWRDEEREEPEKKEPSGFTNAPAEEPASAAAVAALPSREELRKSLEIFEQRAKQAAASASPAEAPVARPQEVLPEGLRAPGSEELLDEEEIDENDTDFYGLAAEEEEVGGDELEEETLDRAAEFGEAHKDSLIERAATGNYETEPPGFASREDEQGEGEEGEEGDARAEDLEESEMAAEGGEGAAAGEGGEASAELRTAPAVAGFQQRATTPGFDPARRGGPQRGQRGRGHGRRNIQRGPRPLITDLLKEGQEILVQIAKEPIGKKGARITSHIALPGRYLVYMPTVDHIGVSRKIASDEERQRLKRILASERNGAHGGFIVRTAAAGTSEDELRADIRFLINLWNEIRQRAEGNAPVLIYHDLNLVERILRDQVTQTFSHIWVDSEPEYERVLRFINRFQPSLVKRVKLYTKETPLFEQFNIQEEINKALKSKVWLKSGGYIVINQTEALVAVDINTGKYVGKTARLEDTIVKTNVEAIQEIVRQIRLRDLGGIIVIDFIDMDERRNRQKVMQALEEALRSDRAPTKVLQFNDFGLVAITRKRVKQSLERTLGTPCTYCTGTGLIKSVATVCNEIYVEMRKMSKQLEGTEVMLRVHPEVAKNLKANGARLLNELEELTAKTVIVKSDPALHQEQFDIN
ncbi:MAG: Rne/Rng family ribonuclease [Terriglobales bacterium]